MYESDNSSAEPTGNLDELLGKLWDDYAGIGEKNISD